MCVVPQSLLKSCLKLGQSQGGIIKLWEEIIGLPAHPPATSGALSMSTAKALPWTRLERLGNAIKALSSSGVANPEDSLTAQAEIIKCYPEGPALVVFDLPDLSPAITVADYLVIKALKVFPKGSGLAAFNFGLNFSWMQSLVLQYQ